MNILSIESSCDETAAAVLTGRLEIKSSVVASQIELHKKTQGVVPEVAARAHTENIIPVIDQALKQAHLTLRQISAVAVTYGPGLITSLLVGLETAKALAFSWRVPLIGVNHIEGHMLANLLERPLTRRTKKIAFNKKELPVVVLTVSGGHTTLLLMRNIADYQVLGSTRDDAAGEAFDKVARMLGLEYPGGPVIGRAAVGGDPHYVEFPRPMLGADNYDFSFSGLKTAVAGQLSTMSKAQITKNLAGLAASFEQAVVDSLLGKAERALKEFAGRELWIVGGVAANVRLRRQAKRLAHINKIKLQIPTFDLCTDNAVMIGVVGALRYRQKDFSDLLKLQVDPNLVLS